MDLPVHPVGGLAGYLIWPVASMAASEVREDEAGASLRIWGSVVLFPNWALPFSRVLVVEALV